MKNLNKANRITPTTGSDGSIRNKLVKKFVPLCKKLPDVRHFAIDLSAYDPIFKKYKLLRRLPYKFMQHLSKNQLSSSRGFPGTIHIVPHTNKKVNKYLKHQSTRLNANLTNPDLFWTIAFALIKRSDAFLAATLAKTHPQWHRKESLVKILRAIQEFKKVRLTVSTIDFKRVWIPKDLNDPARGQRPLGVPTDAWRIYLAMLAQILKVWLRDSYPKEQHGFYYRKGTMTAWKSILKHAFPAKYIVGFDLTKFFDQLRVEYVTNQLRELGTPRKVAMLIEDINLSTPHDQNKKTTIQLERKMLSMATPKTLVEGEWSANLLELEENLGERGWDDFMHFEVYRQIPTLRDLISRYIPILRRAYPEKGNGWSLWDKYLAFRHLTLQPMDWTVNKWKGIPQGAATSPILSSLVTRGCLFPYIKGLIMYADDGIIFSDQPITLEPNAAMIDAGVSWNETKTEIIKENGEWRRNLKFLGKEYDFTLDKLRAKTRKGSTLLYDKEDLVSALQATEKNKQYVRGLGKTWNDFFQSKIFGYIQARLYSGKYDLSNMEQDFSYTWEPGSWADKFPHYGYNRDEKPNVFSSSSIANTWLLKRLKATRNF